MVTGRTKGVTNRATGEVRLFAAQRDDGDGNPTEEYLILRADEFGRLRVASEGAVVIGRTKGVTNRAVGNVVLVAAQREDADGNLTNEYLLLRADENGRLRTVGGAATFLDLTDTPASYVGQTGRIPQVNAGETALEFAAPGGASALFPQMDDLGLTTWGVPGWSFDEVGDSNIVADRLHYIPIYVERSRLFTQIGIHVTGADAGAVARLGVYAGTFVGGDLTPGALIVDAGTVAVGANGQKSIVIAETLAEGFYFLAISSDGTPNIARPATNGGHVTHAFTGRHDAINKGKRAILRANVVDGAAALPDPATAPDDTDDDSSCWVQIGE